MTLKDKLKEYGLKTKEGLENKISKSNVSKWFDYKSIYNAKEPEFKKYLRETNEKLKKHTEELSSTISYRRNYQQENAKSELREISKFYTELLKETPDDEEDTFWKQIVTFQDKIKKIESALNMGGNCLDINYSKLKKIPDYKHLRRIALSYKEYIKTISELDLTPKTNRLEWARYLNTPKPKGKFATLEAYSMRYILAATISDMKNILGPSPSEIEKILGFYIELSNQIDENHPFGAWIKKCSEELKTIKSAMYVGKNTPSLNLHKLVKNIQYYQIMRSLASDFPRFARNRPYDQTNITELEYLEKKVLEHAKKTASTEPDKLTKDDLNEWLYDEMVLGKFTSKAATYADIALMMGLQFVPGAMQYVINK